VSLAGPPVRPRYVIVSLTGYSPGVFGQGRKPRTTWTVMDKLNQGFPVGVDHYKKEYAEIERAEWEAAWEHYLETGEWITPRSEETRQRSTYYFGVERHRKQPFRPWCGVCKVKSPPGSSRCKNCDRRIV
jgi:hypothetical protein